MDRQTLILQVAAPYERAWTTFSATVTTASGTAEVTLFDDGSQSLMDKPYDGVFVGVVDGEYAPYRTIGISGAPAAGAATSLYTGTEQTTARHAVLAYQVRLGDGAVGRPDSLVRVGAAWPSSTAPPAESLPLVAAAMWVCVLLGALSARSGTR